MKTRFAHLTDIHLGNQQYGLPERYNDFARSWLDAAERIAAERPQFVALAGDLFHQRSPEPRTLLHAEAGLETFRRAGIPIVAVSGNHDRTLDRDAYSWMEYLATKGLLILLNPIDAATGEVRYTPYDMAAGCGSFVDFDGVRVIGQPYLGAQAGEVIRRMADQIADKGVGTAEYVVYICHAGLEGLMGGLTGGLSEGQFVPLRSRVDYAGLGHIHMSFRKDGWLYNPGSLENCTLDEDRQEHGFFIVDVDTANDPKHVVTAHSSLRRPVRRCRVAVDAHEAPEEMLAVVATELAKNGERGTNDGGAAPLVEVVLFGKLRFEPGRLSLSAVADTAREATGALHVLVRNLAVSPGEEPQLGTKTRAELEREALMRLFGRHEPYSSQPDEWAAVATEVKDLAVDGADGETIADFLERRLVGIGALSPAAGAALTNGGDK